MTVQYSPIVGATENTTRFQSGRIWADFPKTRRLYNPDHFVYWWDDFDNVPLLTTAAAAINRYPYMSYIDTSDTIAQLVTTKMLGVLRLSVAATDNNGPCVGQANDGVSILLSDTAGDDMPFWYEHRWRKSSITNNQCAIFNGFTEETRCVNDGLLTDDTGVVITTIDIIGFNVLHASGSSLDFVWHLASQTIVTLISGIVTLVADTWYKDGFKYQPVVTGKPTTERIAVIHNGSEQSTYGTATQVAAAAFPEDELGWRAGAKAGEATAVTYDLDWINYAQEKRTS